jgi:hypothetical protein
MGKPMKVAARIAYLCVIVTFAEGLPALATADESEEFERHAIELFLGGASKLEDTGTESGFAVGLGYELRIVRWLGVGVNGEYVTGEVRDGVLLFPVYAHPWRGLRFEIAPGVEFSDEPEEFAVRFGASYELELWRSFSISPEFNVDLVNGETTLVYGASLGWGF